MSTEPSNDRAEESGARKRILRALVLAGVAGLLIVPVTVWAADGFSDVPDGNVHHDAINAIADADVTKGCTPTEYCPSDGVRRDQMASFLDRLGALSGQDPVVNAATAESATVAQSANQADEADHANTADNATNADNAEALQGETADEIGSLVASATFDSVSGLDNTVTNVGSVDVEAPTAGTLVAQAQGNLITFGGGTVAALTVAQAPDTLEPFGAGTARSGKLDGSDTQRRTFAAHPIATFDVSEGTHTIHLNAQRSEVFDAQNVNLTATVLTVTFVPAP